MAKTCLLAAICATARRTNPIRSVAAFTGSSFTSTSTASRYVSGPVALSHLSMSTKTEALSDVSPKILKRVKTADAAPSDEDVAIKGWVRTVRKQKTLAFVEVNDGSSLSGIQCVLSFDGIDEASMAGE
jgi:asparaginyl-tRNA synthetase